MIDMSKRNDPGASRRRGPARLRPQNDIERMNNSAKQRYLRRRLFELEQMIEFYLTERIGSGAAGRAFEMVDGRSELWEDLMDLDYLEASRQAILQAMADLRRQRHSSLEADGGQFGD